jgi:cobalt-zinc-cadmium efflux system protein
LKEAINILLEGVPEGVDIKNIETTILSVDGILEVHDLHIWAITNDKISLTAHLVAPAGNEKSIQAEVQKVLAKQFNITHTTLQIETSRTPDCEVH